jgi:ABC-2 type transport system ATP-binding protein
MECADPRSARRKLEGHGEVLGVTQLGMRLRVLLDRNLPEPLERVRGLLDGKGCEARLTHANLEDVFVAVTRNRDRNVPA